MTKVNRDDLELFECFFEGSLEVGFRRSFEEDKVIGLLDMALYYHLAKKEAVKEWKKK